MTYAPPLAEQRFVLDTVAGIGDLGIDADLVDAILDGAGAFAAGQFAPLNRIGDAVGARWEDGQVTMPAGFREAYRAYVEGGWGSLDGPEEAGGQGLPFSLATVVLENLGTANMAFSLCPMLTVGAIEAIHAHGSEEQKSLYLAKLVSGEWTGTMNLTEPQAGSDVGALRTTATPNPDGSYAIRGTKIFITFGEHDLTDNIVHLVLARTPDAPAGTVTIVGDSFDNAANTTRLDGYALASVRAELPINDRLALYGRVENVADERYQTAAGYGTYGRSAFGGVRLRLN